ncbi:polysaccharide deacetylase family protein [Actinoplanes utahensis]|uniref:polysaccharide deacetylase family protein n=1 Tax=Actinoplanes utahensis TaxID=1869 RepID=UPI0007C7FC04|nr:polysaccharide deacetylase family protein [Actinoplanes utahensis]GIF27017.1 hydrolase [Actinoplanes utahensis]
MFLRRPSIYAGPVVATLAAAVLVPQVGSAATTPPPARTGAASVGSGAAGVDTSGPYGSMRRTGSAAVALTFDDGPDPKVTPQLLDLLKQQRVKATFCLTGWRARDHPAIVRRIAAEGHTLCNHSWQHLEDLGKRDVATIRKDLEATTRSIQRAVPGVPVQYFRAPYGNFTARLNATARESGMTPLSWNVDDQSWMSKEYGKGSAMVQHIVGVVQKNTRQGSIVLGHDMAKPWTVTAYRTLLPWLRQRFQLIPLPVHTIRVPSALAERLRARKPVRPANG